MYRSLGWKTQRKSTIWSKILIKNYKKVPWIKGRDHVTRPIRQGNNPNFEVLFLFLFSVSFFLLFYLSFFQNYPNQTLCSTQNQEWERETYLSVHNFMVDFWSFFFSRVRVTKSTTESAMIGFRERERTREKRLSLTRASILLLWIFLVFALILTLFYSINNETNNNNNKNHSFRLLRQQQQQQQRSFNKALLFHATSKSRTRTRTTDLDDQAGPPEKSLYGNEKRLIHTGPNPLHN